MGGGVTIMIATKDRAADIKRTCAKLNNLMPAPIETLITADGCADGTVGVVKSELPHARLIINKQDI
jgi:hypothetical protein